WPRPSGCCWAKGISLTLLIASTHKDQVWMIADTAITDATKSPRHREYRPKIIPTDQSLFGFAGHVDHADDIVEKALALPVGDPALRALLEGHKWSRKVARDRCADFA